MLRVSVTQIEHYHRVLLYADEASLIASVEGAPFEPTWQMRCGSAWQKLMMHRPSFTGLPEPVQNIEEDGCLFAKHDIHKAIAHIGPCLSEVKATRVWDIDGTPVRVVAQADHVHGLMLQDNKCRFGAADAKHYEQDLQWRFYLAVHEAAALRYNVFSFAKPDDNGLVRLREIVSFRMWRYVGLELDCESWLREFLTWAKERGLLKYLEREGSTPEAA